MDQISREHAFLSLTSPLGQDVLIPVSATIEEAVNRPFLAVVEVVSERDTIDPDALLYQPVCLCLRQNAAPPRYVHGLVRHVAALGRHPRGLHRYRLEIVPKLWFLSQIEDCRIFEDKSVQDILKLLLHDVDITGSSFSIDGPDDARPLTVQFNETALAFFTRLIEDAGWCYLFRHTDSAHTLVVADSASAFTALPGPALALSTDADAGNVARWRTGQATAWGRIDLGDFNADRLALSGGTATTLTASGAGQRTAFQWPSGATAAPDAQARSRLRMEAAEAAAALAEGEGFDAAFVPGGRIAIARGDQAAAFVLLRVMHEARDLTWANADGAPAYRNRFTAHPAALPWRPLPSVPRPRLHGIHSAVVIGPAGEEIHTDALGRIKLRFRWDHRGDATPGGGVWVGVMQPWAGAGIGWINLPRVGSEVAVSFMDGDPDRPVVVGQLYTQASKPPLPLPDQKTRTGLRTRSTPGGGAQEFSELWFDDKKGQELVFLHAQKDLTVEVEHDATTTVTQDRSTTVQKGNDTLAVQQGNRSVTVAQGNDSLTVQQGNRSVDVPLGNHTITSQTGDISLKTAGGAISLEAMTSITLKVGQSSITLDPSGVTIKGLLVSAEGQAMASLKGPILKLNADGLLQAQAGIMMLN